MKMKLVGIGSLVGLSLGCWRLDHDHCATNLGDASCMEGQFCNACEGVNNGCVDELPSITCHAANPPSDGSGTSDESTTDSNGGTLSTSAQTSTVDPTNPSSGSTSAGPNCFGDEDCTEPGSPFCDPDGVCVSCEGMVDPNGACATQDPLAPVCDGGACVQCTAEQVGACGGQTPVCDSDSQCVACTEHSQCPQSACHLDGDLVGACFDEGEVFPIANTMELTNALGQLGMADRAVFVLEAGSYGTTLDVGADVELAILGDAADPPVVTGSGLRAVEIFGNALVYFDGVQISNIAGDGLLCSGTAVWLDDSRVSSNIGLGMDVASGCFAHLRRALVVNNDSGGLDMAGGELYIRNSVVGLNGDALTSFIGGMRIDVTNVEVTYSTIVGNQATNPDRGSLFCAGSQSGFIRNSIVAGSGDSIESCEMLTLEGNAVDKTGLGGSNVDVGAAMPAWFVDPGLNDFHLTATGEGDLAGIATWQEGDPITDVDGEPIPMGAPSVPGYDQP